ncbi:MAG: MBL fold metallo-hydrolase [Chthoniobacterales bacterium]
MKVIVHSGGDQIGASCLEVSSASTRIILDCGWPLDGGDESEPPPVPGLFAPGRKPSAVFLSHAHPDHTGFIRRIPAGVPIYATADTSKIMLVGSCYARGVALPRDAFRKVPVPKQAGSCTPFQVGDLTVTAYPVDHSAYGAVAFLIENGGRRVFYTGDLRFHGRKSGMSQRIVGELRERIDLLVTEGTNVGRMQSGLQSETTVEKTAAALSRSHSSLVAVSFSPQNLDRFVSFFRAALESSRTFVCDHYMAAVLHMVNRPSFPEPKPKSDLRVYFPKRRKIIEKFEKHSRTAAITMDEVLGAPHKFMMLVRPTMLASDFGGRIPEKTLLLYGMWSGYRTKKEWLAAEALLTTRQGAIQACHASGHAHPDQLFDFINALAPRKVLPVHTSHRDKFEGTNSPFLTAKAGDAIIV